MKKSVKTVKSSVWIDREEYPFESHYYQKARGGRMHYVDVGRGQPIVMVHGNPTWSFAYRHLIKQLSGEYRCIAPDHLGFGLSDKLKKFSYKPADHADNLESLIRELNLKNIILMVHDYGGPIGLNYAINNPHNISRLVVMNTWMWSLKGDPTLEKANTFLNKKVGAWLYEKMNFQTRFMLKQAVEDTNNLPKNIQAQYINALPTPDSRKGNLTAARELIGSSDWFESLWRSREAIQDIPTLLLWGMQDPFIHLDSLDRWHNLFNRQRMVRLAGAGHLLMEDQKYDLHTFVRNFLQDNEVEGLSREKQLA